MQNIEFLLVYKQHCEYLFNREFFFFVTQFTFMFMQILLKKIIKFSIAVNFKFKYKL